MIVCSTREEDPEGEDKDQGKIKEGGRKEDADLLSGV